MSATIRRVLSSSSGMGDLAILVVILGMCAKNRSGIREVGISIMSKSGISFFLMGLRCGNQREK